MTPLKKGQAREEDRNVGVVFFSAFINDNYFSRQQGPITELLVE